MSAHHVAQKQPATPVRPPRSIPRAAGKIVGRTRLVSTQRWLLDAITGPVAPTSLAPLGGAAVAPRIGLGIYRHAYRARLEECLADDFPAVQALIGAEAFARLAAAVITDHPPTDATLNRYGRHLPRWLTAHRGTLADGAVVRDLARLEWALVEAIHAPLAAPVTPADLASVPPDAWAELRFARAPSLRLFDVVASVDIAYRQHLRGVAVTTPPRGRTTMAILRRPDGLERHAIPPAHGRLLRSLASGRPLGQAILGSGLPPEAIADACASIIRTGGLIAR